MGEGEEPFMLVAIRPVYSRLKSSSGIHVSFLFRGAFWRGSRIKGRRRPRLDLHR